MSTATRGGNVTVRIGIPRAFLYYSHYPFWEALFETLGHHVVVSRPTGKPLMDQGIKYAQDETCLPVKLAFGHLLDLRDRADAIFLPLVRSLEAGKYLCPKIIGLPDMVSGSLPPLPPLWRPVIDLYAGGDLESATMDWARSLASEAEVRRAVAVARQRQAAFRGLVEQGYWPSAAMALARGQRPRAQPPAKTGNLNVAVVGHPYIVCDRYASLDLVSRLQARGVQVTLSEMIPDGEIQTQVRARLSKELFWTFGTRLLGAGFHFATQAGIHGLIFLSVFGCGSDAMVEPLVAGAARAKVPYMSLTLDEHSGEAGVVTRVEAFIDMVHRRCRREGYLSPHGQPQHRATGPVQTSGDRGGGGAAHQPEDAGAGHCPFSRVCVPSLQG